MPNKTAIPEKEAKLKHITEADVHKLLKGASKSRNPVRDKLIIMMLYRHGLRKTELRQIELKQILLDDSLFNVHRIKRGVDSTHRIEGDELRLLRRYLKIRKGKHSYDSPLLFISEQGNQFSRSGIDRIVARSAELAEMEHLTPHTLRHSCGFHLINQGHGIRQIQVYLGHSRIESTQIYTALDGNAFNDFRFKTTS